MSNSQLLVDQGRHRTIPHHLRYCTSCNLNQIENDLHLYFECTEPHISQLRDKLFKKLPINVLMLPNIKLNEILLMKFPANMPNEIRATIIDASANFWEQIYNHKKYHIYKSKNN